MRFAPPKRQRIADRERGLNQISVRSYNERLVLTLLLQNQGISRLEIGQKSGLSAQTVSVIVRSLEQEGLVTQGQAQRGRVGAPLIPMSLNRDGAYSVGISIGLHQIEVVLIDFVGTVLHHSSFQMLIPESDDNQSLLIASIRECISVLHADFRSRIAGVGLALPAYVETWDTQEDVSSQSSLAGIKNSIERAFDLPVFVQNDITAAASGESMFGVAKKMADYLFLFIGERLHSRLILNHKIYNGNYSISPESVDFGILQLERILANKSISVEALWDFGSDWAEYGESLEEWRRQCCDVEVRSIRSLAHFVNIDTVVISSSAPHKVCLDICTGLQVELPGINAVVGDIAVAPIAVGAASLPFSSRFMVQVTLQSTALIA